MASIPQRIASFEDLKNAGEFALMARFLLDAKGNREVAIRAAEKSGSSRIANVLRAAVDPVTLSDANNR
jgi:hypothetical protein